MDSVAARGGGSNPKDIDDDFQLESGGYHHDSTNHHHYGYFSGAAVRTTLAVFVVVGITCLALNQSAYPTQFFQRSNTNQAADLMQHNVSSPIFHQPPNSPANDDDEEENNLENTLKRAAMADNKTVIITTLNAAWTEPNSIFDLFLESFRIGNQTQNLLKHVVVVALDQKAYSRCLQVRLHCYALTTTGVDFSGEAFFMSQDYLKMMWRRIDFLRTVLEMGYNFVFTDADIMWLRNPFPHFYSDTNFQISCDSFGGNPTDLNNAPNGGFNYVKSSTQTIEFYKFWYEAREFYPRKHDQDVLNKIKYNPFTRDIGLEIKFLDTAYFGGFCQPSKDLNLVCTMHANCCAGLDNKIHDLKILLEDWRNYLSLPENVRKAQPPSWSVPQSCG
ncbi:UNVERIFIED_CONTAM: hypothetical protein Slati_4348900 [Sesamum latifolium]|uniref:Nucleotide-diphospho-sugar transferase domain-containing protein n=1 Tax=Sesamum latifolium TaxID=2727402 RepID=A0AAW2SN22_9LAMI